MKSQYVSYKDLGSLMHLIATANGSPERQKLLSFLLYKEKYNTKILCEVVQHIVYYLIDNPARELVDIHLAVLVAMKQEPHVAKRLKKLITIIEACVEDAFEIDVSSCIKMHEDGLEFTMP